MIDGLQGARAVVTGGASGIGAACVDALEACGATVHVADISGDPPVDVTDESSVEAAVTRVRDDDDGLNVLVNAAGVFTDGGPAADLPLEDIKRNIDVNLLGTFRCCQAFEPLLRARKGAIVNIASMAAHFVFPGTSGYVASKGGVAALTRALAVDWGPNGVRVNCVSPGWTATPMVAGFMTDKGEESLAHRVPLGRANEPSEVAAVIAFLASPLASAMTGAVVPIDGGYTAGEPMIDM